MDMRAEERKKKEHTHHTIREPLVTADKLLWPSIVVVGSLHIVQQVDVPLKSNIIRALGIMVITHIHKRTNIYYASETFRCADEYY